MFVMGAIMLAGFLASLAKRRTIQRPALRSEVGSTLVVLALLLLIWHVFSAMRSDDQVLATREVVKLGLGLLSLWTALAFFPPEQQFLERFWRLVIWASAALMALLIYKSAFVFASPYLISEISVQTRVGKNQVGQYLAYILPFAIAYLWGTKQKVIALLPVLTLIIAWIYLGSRGAWIAVLVGLIFGLPKVSKARGFRVVTIYVALIIVVGLASWWILESYVPAENLEYSRRIEYFYNPAGVPEYNTYAVRWHRLTIFGDLFLTSPLIGVGLTNSGFRLGTLPHNDYLGILADLGIVGLGVFLLILGIIWANIWPTGSRYQVEGMSWVFLGNRGALVSVLTFMLTMDKIYTTTLFWVFLGVALVTSQAERLSRKRADTHQTEFPLTGLTRMRR
jgi:O-antigen ligase